ncbi:hypothetical protein VNO78_22620 [Psophocarpus tetragonolobus]|uniref:Uncharacterized protein n=1 Tax=Psophocarpus tetragonolobus TaxID=3891 RepID=A0AAN9XCV7_PSOTE
MLPKTLAQTTKGKIVYRHFLTHYNMETLKCLDDVPTSNNLPSFWNVEMTGTDYFKFHQAVVTFIIVVKCGQDMAMKTSAFMGRVK